MAAPNRVTRVHPRFGIRQKVILILVSVLLGAMTVSGWWALEQAREDVWTEAEQRGADISRFVAKSLAYNVVGYDYHTLQLLLDSVTGTADVDYARVVGARGNTMAEAGLRRDPAQRRLLFEEPIVLDGMPLGHLELHLSAQPTVSRLQAQTVALLQREAVIILLIAVAEFIALSLIIVRPARRMTNALAGRLDEEGAIIAKLPEVSRDEFGVLAAQFNRLADQLNRANRRLRSRIAAADERLRQSNRELTVQAQELQRMNAELKRISITDALTGLYNRRHFEEILETELALCDRYGDQSSLVLIDIDHFKRINDTYGHAAGDAVLKGLAELLRQQFRKTDVLCRIGGEEFSALCKRTTEAEAMRLAEKLRAAVAERVFALPEGELGITISAGVATVPADTPTLRADIFYQRADAALYLSKKQGRDCVTSAGTHDVRAD
ncbi:diguanylate cyclase [Ectothiorhodospiraceae bacterium 2226]|nr:diguanylate cyclase [Ectothiorhodospiraceae bacterium 2226]